MVTVKDYGSEITNVSKSVLLELLLILRSYLHALVLVGGWAPHFLLERYQQDKEFKHIGSVDIDFAIDPKLISLKEYKTIVELLKKRGYKPVEDKLSVEIPFKFEREIKGVKISVDFLSQGYLNKTKKRHRKVQHDLRARIMKGCQIVFNHNFEYELQGKLPEKGGNTGEKLKIADVLASIVTKGYALAGRYNEKDAYDIYSVVSYYKNGMEDSAKEVKPFVKDKVVNESLNLIKERFRKIDDIGPVWVGNFVYPDNEEARKRIIADAFMRVNRFLELVF